MSYTHSLYSYNRIRSHEVKIGEVAMGGPNPIRIQSMTTTDTMDTEATIEQTLRMVESGSEYVRITAPSKKEAENLQIIKEGLKARGCEVPLIADIHFTPNAAEIAAKLIEKVRVNPGNYADKKKFNIIEYTDEQYQAELDRIHKRFAPLVKICKEYGAAMRIGTNHGSLSDRILSRYGDTPLGMVESALEFLRICELYDYDQVVLSMKASNPQVMVQAYRLLVEKMLANGKVYPLHLGVTEAGEGEDGRIKSAVGIGTLLLDGIGDTVRVSLTEEPEYEAPVAQFLVDLFTKNQTPSVPTGPENPINPFAFSRRGSREVLNLGSSQVPRVVADFSGAPITYERLGEIGYSYNAVLDKYNFAEMAADYLYLGSEVPAIELPGGLKPVYDAATWNLLRNRADVYPYFDSLQAYMAADKKHDTLNWVNLQPGEPVSEEVLSGPIGLVLSGEGADAAHEWRRTLYALMAKGVTTPVILKTSFPTDFSFYTDDHLPEKFQLENEAMAQLFLAGQIGTMVVDGLIDGLWITPTNNIANRAAFGILQASRLRTTKTEYISCPSCGRTLFDLQETTARIRKRTEHLKGVKIGIMGCIVNGPGEMADADYGYVGVGPDKIALYRGQEVVERGVKTAQAVDKLIDLIREDGKWVDQVPVEA